MSGGVLIAGATGDSTSTDYYIVHQKELMLPVVEQANQSSNDDYSIYPNPSRGIFKIEVKGEARHAVINIYNTTGSRVMSVQVDNGKSSISQSLPSGIYIIDVLADEKSLGKNKLIVHK